MLKYSSSEWTEWCNSLPPEGWGGRTAAEWDIYQEEGMEKFQSWIMDLPDSGYNGFSKQEWQDYFRTPG